MKRLAQCQCGGLRVTATGQPDRVYVCHCKDCQRRTGSVMHTGAYYRRSRIVAEGVDKVYSRPSDGGRAVHFHFCPECGTTVWWEGEARARHCGVSVGCFADPSYPPPVYSLFEETKHPWVRLPEGVNDPLRRGKPIESAAPVARRRTRKVAQAAVA